MSECRFCSKKLNEKEIHSINDEIKEYFIKITQIQLLETESCSKYICELCLRAIQLAFALRTQLLKNEERLYEMLQKNDDFVEVSSFEPQFGRSDQTDEVKADIHDPTTSNLLSHNENSDNMDYETSESSMKSFDSQFGYATQPYIHPSYPAHHSHQNMSSNQAILNQLLTNPVISYDVPPLTKIPIGRLKTEAEEGADIIQVKKEKCFEDSGVIKESKLIETRETECQAQFDSNQMGIFSLSHHFTDFSDDSGNQGKVQTNKKSAKGKAGVDKLNIKPKYNSNATQTPYRSSEKIFYKNSSTKSFECLYCTFTTDSQHVIKTHMIQNHNKQIPTHKCPHCESTYFKGSNLKRHILVKHFNHRYECSVTGCNIQFRDGSSLKRHLSAAHPNLSREEAEQIMNKTKVKLPDTVEIKQANIANFTI